MLLQRVVSLNTSNTTYSKHVDEVVTVFKVCQLHDALLPLFNLDYPVIEDACFRKKLLDDVFVDLVLYWKEGNRCSILFNMKLLKCPG